MRGFTEFNDDVICMGLNKYDKADIMFIITKQSVNIIILGQCLLVA